MLTIITIHCDHLHDHQVAAMNIITIITIIIIITVVITVVTIVVTILIIRWPLMAPRCTPAWRIASGKLTEQR